MALPWNAKQKIGRHEIGARVIARNAVLNSTSGTVAAITRLARFSKKANRQTGKPESLNSVNRIALEGPGYQVIFFKLPILRT